MCELLLLGESSYSVHSLIRKLLNSNFHYFEQISKSPVFELRKAYILYCLIRVPLIQTFANLKNFFGPYSNFCPFMIKTWEKILPSPTRCTLSPVTSTLLEF